MITALIGHSGFVGGNLFEQFRFDHTYNSSNIADISNHSFDLVVCAGVRAVKWWANQHPAEDLASIEALLHHLRKVDSKEMLVISTIDVYPSPVDVEESTDIDGLPNHAYGKNRLYFENEVRKSFPQAQIVRLPGLFGPGLKKNIVYDLIHNNGLSKINPDSVFQYYDLTELWKHLSAIRNLHLPLVNLATAPLPTSEILHHFFPEAKVGQEAGPSARYDMRTLYAKQLGGENGYIQNSAEVLQRMGNFITSQKEAK
jgi:nucleoside-diphosphate-sugar epimerase